MPAGRDARGTREPRQERHPRRLAVLDTLRAAEEPLGVADVAERLGIHINTARFHLDALTAEGSVESALETSPGGGRGRGRPRAVYTARPGMDRGGPRGYRLLARILLGQLAASGEAGAPGAQAPADAVQSAGAAWGRYLVARQPPGRPALTPEQAVERLTEMLDDLDFAPEPGAAGAEGVPDVIRLRHCPFLELAEEYGDLVCRAHLGLMQGALSALDTGVRARTLAPFAEPGACVARLSGGAAR